MQKVVRGGAGHSCEMVNSNIDEIKTFDIKNIWDNKILQHHRFGFIGSNYQRLYIRFLSIIKNVNSPNQYFVYGKSRVSNNICEFIGTIDIQESYYLQSDESFTNNSGVMVGEYVFYENSENIHSGVFEGRFVTYWEKDKEGNLIYKELPVCCGNNQFTGTWTSYEKNLKLIANWGNNRIINSGDLDVGTSEFGVNKKYQANGWDSFIKYTRGGYDKSVFEEAGKEEMREWWKEE